MPQTDLSTFERHYREIQELRSTILDREKLLLSRLPALFGFKGPQELYAAVLAASDTVSLPDVHRSASIPGLRISAAQQQAIIDSLRGGQPDRTVAQTFNVSRTTIYKIKKQVGLVRSRAFRDARSNHKSKMGRPA